MQPRAVESAKSGEDITPPTRLSGSRRRAATRSEARCRQSQARPQRLITLSDTLSRRHISGGNSEKSLQGFRIAGPRPSDQVVAQEASKNKRFAASAQFLNSFIHFSYLGLTMC